MKWKSFKQINNQQNQSTKRFSFVPAPHSSSSAIWTVTTMLMMMTTSPSLFFLANQQRIPSPLGPAPITQTFPTIAWKIAALHLSTIIMFQNIWEKIFPTIAATTDRSVLTNKLLENRVWFLFSLHIQLVQNIWKTSFLQPRVAEVGSLSARAKMGI